MTDIDVQTHASVQMIMAKKASAAKLKRSLRETAPIDDMLQHIKEFSAKHQVAYDELEADFEDAKDQIRSSMQKQSEMTEELATLREYKKKNESRCVSEEQLSIMIQKKKESFTEVPLASPLSQKKLSKSDVQLENLKNDNKKMKKMLEQQKVVQTQMENSVIEAKNRSEILFLQVKSLKLEIATLISASKEDANTISIMKEECQLLKTMVRSNSPEVPHRVSPSTPHREDPAALERALVQLKQKLMNINAEIDEKVENQDKEKAMYDTIKVLNGQNEEKENRITELSKIIHEERTQRLSIEKERTLSDSTVLQMTRRIESDKSKMRELLDDINRLQQWQSQSMREKEKLKNMNNTLKKQREILHTENENKTSRINKLSEHIGTLTQRANQNKQENTDDTIEHMGKSRSGEAVGFLQRI